MTEQEKKLLLADLCARVAFGPVKCQVKVFSFNEEMDEHIEWLDDEIIFIEPRIHNVYLYEEGTDVDISDIKPYLRPMSSMTEEERDELYTAMDWYGEIDEAGNVYTKGQEKVYRETFYEYLDWLISHHFDFRGLIPMGLALEAPEGMYKVSNE